VSKTAILVSAGEPTKQEGRLARILDFFGVPWSLIEPEELQKRTGEGSEPVVFCSIEMLAPLLNKQHGTSRASYYAYSSENRSASERGLQALFGSPHISLQPASAKEVVISVSRDFLDYSGVMSGIHCSVRLGTQDNLLLGLGSDCCEVETLVTADDYAVFAHLHHEAGSIFICASSNMVDLDQPVGAGFYDVKGHFCSAVPLVMFIRGMFPDTAWSPQELGACMIIDDPLLRRRYGFCDFTVLRQAMQRYEFTTNIAFIPWNWRRTSSRNGSFFNSEPRDFSISVHGCDHTKAEFGDTSSVQIAGKALLAQSRMRKHESRTGISHDAVMVFPQGVFSSVCPEVLKRAGFLAAVNTEIEPSNAGGSVTTIRDVWSVAIMRYGSFPVFTRRYAHHGLENFAFDLLLGKPCLIVAHHEFFKNNCEHAIELIQQLRSLHCSLQWRSLAEVIRRACRQRPAASGGIEVEMFGTELRLTNPYDHDLNIQFRKAEAQPDSVEQVQRDGLPLAWGMIDNELRGEAVSPAHHSMNIRIAYRQRDVPSRARRRLRFEISVAGRRLLSEFRDDYLSRSFLMKPTAGPAKALARKAN
jgi:hypothetical protein